jgi:hypothetical protein
MDVNFTWIPTWHPMDHISWSLELFQKPPLGDKANTKMQDHGKYERPQLLVCSILSYVRVHMNRNSLK